MKDAQKPDHVGLTTLINRLREGRYVIPDFQRDFEWKPWDIRELMRSVFLDYYVGSLLLWKGKPESFNALACEPLYGFQGKSDPTHIVLDGQQRLTALHYAFLAPNVPAPSRHNRFLYFIRVDQFMAEAYDEAFHYDWTKGAERLLEDTKSQFETHMFPMAVVGQGGWALPNWVQDYEKHWRSKGELAQQAGDLERARLAARCADDAHAFGEHLRGITEQYQISYIELDRDLALPKVCDIFTQINSRGIRLDIFDLINALLKPRGLQLKHLWRKASPKLDFVETERMNVYVLQVMSILRQAYCSPKYLYYLLPGQERTVRDPTGALRKEQLVPTIDDFQKRWEQAVVALERAIKLLRHPQEFGAITSQYMPYFSILPAFAALQTTARDLPACNQLDAQRKIRHWYWASVFMNRYSGAVESTAARDYLDVKAWFDDDLVEPLLIGEFKERFRRLELRRETKRGTSVYNGIFNLLVLRGARDWMTGNVPQYDDLDDHHIVPKNWGKTQSLDTSIDTILNRTPLSSATNREVISDRLPSAYLPELIKANSEASVRATLETHFISPTAFEILLRSPFTTKDYEAFIAERQRTLQDAIEDLLIKERLDLPPQLRELDAKVEAIELRLRGIIEKRQIGTETELPQHIADRIQQRVQVATKKNPAFDIAHYSTLAGKLEYADLRDLEAVIVNKAAWPVYADIFGNKEILAKRFDQLAELRNGIRHSRTVDEVTGKEGEASLAWFAKLLDDLKQPSQGV